MHIKKKIVYIDLNVLRRGLFWHFPLPVILKEWLIILDSWNHFPYFKCNYILNCVLLIPWNESEYCGHFFLFWGEKSRPKEGLPTCNNFMHIYTNENVCQAGLLLGSNKLPKKNYYPFPCLLASMGWSCKGLAHHLVHKISSNILSTHFTTLLLTIIS